MNSEGESQQNEREQRYEQFQQHFLIRTHWERANGATTTGHIVGFMSEHLHPAGVRFIDSADHTRHLHKVQKD